MNVGKIVISGFRDKGFEAKVREFHCEIVSSVSKKVDILVVKDIKQQSGKALKASALGIKILDKTSFTSCFLSGLSPYDVRNASRRKPKVHYIPYERTGLYWMKRSKGLELSHGDCIAFRSGNDNMIHDYTNCEFYVDARIREDECLLTNSSKHSLIVPSPVTATVLDALQFYSDLIHDKMISSIILNCDDVFIRDFLSRHPKDETNAFMHSENSVFELSCDMMMLKITLQPQLHEIQLHDRL